MITKDEKKRIKRYKRNATQFSSRGKSLSFLMMSIWILPSLIISQYYWGVDLNINNPIILPMVFIICIFIVLFLEKELFLVSDEFKKYLLIYSSVTLCLEFLFMIDFNLIFLAFVVAPINTWLFVSKCEQVHVKLMNTKV